MLNASVGFQRVLGRVRRPLKHGPASDAPREARRFAVAPKLRHGVHVVVAASRLAPVREQRATGRGRGPGRRRESRDTRSAATLPDLTPRPRARRRDGRRGDRRRRLGRQRLGRTSCRPDRRHQRRRHGTADRGRWRYHGRHRTAMPPATSPSVAARMAIDATDGTDVAERRRRPRRQRRPGHHRLHGQRRVRPARRRDPTEVAVRRHRFRRHRDRPRRTRPPSKARSSTTARWSSRSPSTRRSPTAAAWSGPTRSSPATRSPTSPRSSRSRR